MHWFRGKIFVRSSSRHAVTLLLLVSLCGTLFPVPLCLPVSTGQKDQSKPFPCQDRVCGCRSAEQCKKKCCCFSNSQKIAWAKRKGVEISHVVDLAAANGNTKSHRPTCCLKQTAQKSAPQLAESVRRTSKSTKQTPTRFKIVLSVAAQECHGAEVTFAGQPIFVLPQGLAVETLIEPICERFILCGSQLAPGVSEPPVPPPRLVTV